MEFSEPGIFNYSTLLLSEKGDALYVGAREAVFELSKTNVTVRNNKVAQRKKTKQNTTIKYIFPHLLIFFSFPYFFQVQWTAAENYVQMCTLKGKSKEVNAGSRATRCLTLRSKSNKAPPPVSLQRDCLNYIRVLQVMDSERLYVCGTHAFQPQCDYLVGQGPAPPHTAPSGSLQPSSVLSLSAPPAEPG